jgi:peptidoglycan/xylan/chitin deacetylase (PgdA/CDA1 family)
MTGRGTRTGRYLMGALYRTGLSHLYRRVRGPRQVVITWHNVLPEEWLAGDHPYRVDTSRRVFEAQIAYISRHWPVLPASALLSDEPGVLLTFDDGMRNAYETVAPILEEHGLTGVFAVCPALVGGEIPHLWRDHVYLVLRARLGREVRLPMDGYDRPVQVGPAEVNPLAEQFRRWVIDNRVVDVYAVVRELCARNGLPYRREEHRPERFHPAGWSMLELMQERGHRVVSHTLSHRILSLLPAEQKELEMASSRSEIERRLGTPTECMMYPYGGLDEVDADCLLIAAATGHRRGFLNKANGAPLAGELALPRVALPNSSVAGVIHPILTGLRTAVRGLWQSPPARRTLPAPTARESSVGQRV